MRAGLSTAFAPQRAVLRLLKKVLPRIRAFPLGGQGFRLISIPVKLHGPMEQSQLGPAEGRKLREKNDALLTVNDEALTQRARK